MAECITVAEADSLSSSGRAWQPAEFFKAARISCSCKSFPSVSAWPLAVCLPEVPITYQVHISLPKNVLFARGKEGNHPLNISSRIGYTLTFKFYKWIILGADTRFPGEQRL
jgi:hypothetical protein